MKDCSILLQGKIDKECFNLWIKNYRNYNVIVSIWEDEDLSNFIIPNNWILVVNKYPLIRFREIANLDYQIITTLNGLNKVKTKWVIKMRCDEYWSNIEKVYSKMIEFPDKIITGSMFFRKWGIYKFHPSDKIIGGTIDNLFLMFKTAISNIEANICDSPIPESQLGFAFVYAKENYIELSDISFNKIEEIDDEIVKKHLFTGCALITKEMLENLIIDSKFNHIDWKTTYENLERFKCILDELLRETKNKWIKEIDDKPYMIKWFDVIDINELKPYIATKSGFKGRLWYRDNFDNDENDCFSNSIND